MIWVLGMIAAIILLAALVAVRDRARGTPRDPAIPWINPRTGEWTGPGSGSHHGHGHGHGAGHAGGHGGHVGGHGG
jgi:hypothetical protein